MADRILIDELRFRAIVGVHPWEREHAQEIIVSLELELSLVPAAASDELQHSVDYDQLSRAVIHCAKQARRRTLEALSEDLAALCLQDEKVERVTVRVDKPGAVRQARSVGVRITRDRDPRASGR